MGEPTLTGGKTSGEEEEGSGSGFCWVANHCVILSTLLLTYRIRELGQGWLSVFLAMFLSLGIRNAGHFVY